MRTYSGGMIRRLELAQALVSGPRLLVLDEPTIGLDPIGRSDVWARVETLRRESGHDRAASPPTTWTRPTSCATALALMHKGRIRAIGTPAELKSGARSRGHPRGRVPPLRRGPISTPIREVNTVKSVAPAAPPAGSADRPVEAHPSSLGRALPRRVGALCIVELQKMRHDRTEIYTRAIQPLLWLLIFGETFNHIHAIPTGGVPYLDYLAPGILAQSALFIAIFYGIQIIWERDAGVLTKLHGHSHAPPGPDRR